MKVLPMWRSGCFSLPKRLAAGSLAACLLLAQPATFAAAGDELRGIIEIDDPVVKRMQVVPISEAPRKDYWPRVVEGIKWAYRERPAELKDWEALGLSLAGQRRRVVVRTIEDAIGKLPYTVDQPRDYWQTPMETAERGFRGDCEDYAALAFFTLLLAGLPQEDILAMMGRDRRGNAHAVVLVRDEDPKVWLLLDFADPGATPSWRSGFSPVSFGNLTHVGLNVTKK